MSEKKKSKEIVIYINGRQLTVSGKEISFTDLVHLAFDPSSTSEIENYTITFSKGGNSNKPEGSMVIGDVEKLKKGMIFNVTLTDKS
jgi:hypothetical protein